MLLFDQTSIDIVSIHQVGNKYNGEDITISKHPLATSTADMDAMLKKYFLQGFTTPEFYQFTSSNDDSNLNPLNQFVSDVFKGNGNFHTNSVNIAKHLYESSRHPMIKAGDVMVVYFSKVKANHETCDAIGIFKSETKNPFLKIQVEKGNAEILCDKGIQLDKPDKACLILNQNDHNGYKMVLFDKTNKGEEATFFKEMFLNVRPIKDEFLQTKSFLQMTQAYISQQITEEFEVNKTEQIDLLNRSLDYFKTHDNFVQAEFEQDVLMDENIVQSFQKFNQTYAESHDLEIPSNFDISLPAVKKQSRVFKSILKLDRNFHIYIHGNKDLIEHGIEKDGRKFYKIYYENES